MVDKSISPTPGRDDRQSRLFLLMVLASLLDIGLVVGRTGIAGVKRVTYDFSHWPEIQGLFGLPFGFLLWNLFLAWVPYLAALRFERTAGRLKDGLARWVWFAVWLFFLPNAPYIVTDFIHLHPRPPVPIWYDMIMLFAFASTGLTIGVLSLYEIQRTLRREYSLLVCQVIVLLSVGLSGFGVWLGRFQRWNSWDILTNPQNMLKDVLFTLTERNELIRAAGISMLMASMLLFGYLLLTTLLTTGKQHH